MKIEATCLPLLAEIGCLFTHLSSSVHLNILIVQYDHICADLWLRSTRVPRH